MPIICDEGVIGLGNPCGAGNPLTIPYGIILTDPTFEFSTFSAFATQANYLSGIVAGTLVPIMGCKGIEAKDVEDSVHTTDTGEKIFLYHGKRGQSLKFHLSLYQHQILMDYPLKKWRAFFVDVEGNVLGTSPDGTKVKGFSISSLFVNKLPTAQKDAPRWTMVEFQESIVDELDRRGVYVNPSTWLASDLEPVTQVELTVGTCSSFEFTATVQFVDGFGLKSTGAKNTQAISGLVAANFYVIDQGGVVETVTVTESSTVPGTYTVTGVDITSGTCAIVPSTTMLFKSDTETVSAAT